LYRGVSAAVQLQSSSLNAVVGSRKSMEVGARESKKMNQPQASMPLLLSEVIRESMELWEKKKRRTRCNQPVQIERAAEDE